MLIIEATCSGVGNGWKAKAWFQYPGVRLLFLNRLKSGPITRRLEEIENPIVSLEVFSLPGTFLRRLNLPLPLSYRTLHTFRETGDFLKSRFVMGAGYFLVAALLGVHLSSGICLTKEDTRWESILKSFHGTKKDLQPYWVPVVYELQPEGPGKPLRFAVEDLDRDIQDEKEKRMSFFKIPNLPAGRYTLSLLEFHTGTRSPRETPGA